MLHCREHNEYADAVCLECGYPICIERCLRIAHSDGNILPHRCPPSNGSVVASIEALLSTSRTASLVGAGGVGAMPKRLRFEEITPGQGILHTPSDDALACSWYEAQLWMKGFREGCKERDRLRDAIQLHIRKSNEYQGMDMIDTTGLEEALQDG